MVKKFTGGVGVGREWGLGFWIESGDFGLLKEETL